ncbi:unnamed protein product [marine sediment metagenome]|uniref:Uncharacterized protein n=1 Tax=marine sediment metagenome TaxID=412755 RepID=X1GNX7_9ZZZZ
MAKRRHEFVVVVKDAFTRRTPIDADHADMDATHFYVDAKIYRLVGPISIAAVRRQAARGRRARKGRR